MATLQQIERQVELLTEHLSQVSNYSIGTLEMLRVVPTASAAGGQSPVPASPLDRISYQLAQLGELVVSMADVHRQTRVELFGESIEPVAPHGVVEYTPGVRQAVVQGPTGLGRVSF